MPHAKLADTIEAAFRDRAAVSPQTGGDIRAAVDEALGLLDQGKLRVAERRGDTDGPEAWHVNQWLKKAVLLSFRLNDMTAIAGGPGGATWWDKVPSKFEGWGTADFTAAGFRAVPNCVVRRSAYIAPDVVLMPSFVNLGAYVDSGTMVDTWSTVGSCAQIGKNVHLSGGVGIGGVLEPLQANPTIIEDDCFIGARSEVVEGVVVGRGAVIAMGTFISASTKIVDRASGKVHMGYVPPYSVVVSGSLPGKPFPDGTPGPSLYCAVIVKTVDQRTREKTAINELLRT
jgi:2,3,4,5-tetrahydropyridine-2-carboxylate N-succinyltransferase